MKAQTLPAARSTFVYFWLGMLTGALLVIATMMIQSMAQDGGASIIRRPTNSYTQMGGQPNMPTNTLKQATNTKSMGGQPNMPAAKTLNTSTKSMGGQPN